MISFEFPIVERVRILLRLEELFRRLTHFSNADGADEHHVALQTLFDMAELGARGKQRIEKNFCWQVCARQMTAYYRQVLANENG